LINFKEDAIIKELDKAFDDYINSESTIIYLDEDSNEIKFLDNDKNIMILDV